MAYKAKTIQNSKQFAKYMGDTVADLGPYIVLAFFAAQFIAVFKYSHLGEMLALAGFVAVGCWLFVICLRVAGLFGQSLNRFYVCKICIHGTGICAYVNASRCCA